MALLYLEATDNFEKFYIILNDYNKFEFDAKTILYQKITQQSHFQHRFKLFQAPFALKDVSRAIMHKNSSCEFGQTWKRIMIFILNPIHL